MACKTRNPAGGNGGVLETDFAVGLIGYGNTKSDYFVQAPQVLCGYGRIRSLVHIEVRHG